MLALFQSSGQRISVCRGGGALELCFQVAKILQLAQSLTQARQQCHLAIGRQARIVQLFALIQRVFDPFATAVIKRILITVAGAASKFARAFDGALQANLPMVPLRCEIRFIPWLSSPFRGSERPCRDPLIIHDDNII